MQKTILNQQIYQLLFLLLSLTLLTSLKTSGQIILQDEPLSLKPIGFYIAGVTNESTDKSIDISRFIDRNLPKDKSLRPVVISIKELEVTETTVTAGQVDGHIKLHLSFGLQKDYGIEHLVDYQGGLHFISNGSNSNTLTERHLRTILKTGLDYFNDWMKANVDINRKLAKDVKISFTDYMEKSEGDTIYYAANRPLTWADFQSRNKPNGQYEAVVMPSIGYNQEAEIIKGTINVNITLKAYVPKSACWANYTGRTAYALNHEQRHFDIVKIISEQFKQKILAKKLTPDTFEAFINMQYLDSFRDMNAMQKAYDKETSHGSDKYTQEVWNDRIDKFKY